MSITKLGEPVSSLLCLPTTSLSFVHLVLLLMSVTKCFLECQVPTVIQEGNFEAFGLVIRGPFNVATYSRNFVLNPGPKGEPYREITRLSG